MAQMRLEEECSLWLKARAATAWYRYSEKSREGTSSDLRLRLRKAARDTERWKKLAWRALMGDTGVIDAVIKRI